MSLTEDIPHIEDVPPPVTPAEATARVLLVWDAALGRSRALVEAAVPAAFAMQTHLAFVPLMVIVVAWYVAWTRRLARLVPGPDGALEAADETKAPTWTLDSLTATARERGIEVHRSQVRRILLAEGVRWRHPRSWAVSTDPDFAPVRRTFDAILARSGGGGALGPAGPRRCCPTSCVHR